MKSKAPKKRERRPTERPDEIAQAALALFCERGYHATSMDDVARAANVTKGAVYHHFKSKEHVLQTALKSYFDATLDQARKSAGELSVEAPDLMRSVLYAASELWMRPGFVAVFSLVFGEAGRVAPGARASFLELGPFRGWTALSEVIRKGQKQGAFRSDVDPYVSARTIACALALQSMLLGTGGLSAAQMREAFTDSLETHIRLLSTEGRPSNIAITY